MNNYCSGKSQVRKSLIKKNKAYDYNQNQTHIHTNVHTKGLQILMAKCTRSFLSSLNDQTVTNFELKTFL